MEYVAVVSGRQVTPKLVKGLPKASMPLEPTVADEKVWSYNVTGKGSGMATPQSSQFMPMLLVPATNVPDPVA
jgi:hypothetical protein